MTPAHPTRDFEALAADLARFDFSTHETAQRFIRYAADSWTCDEITFMLGMKPRMIPGIEANNCIWALDELQQYKDRAKDSACERGYLQSSITRGDDLRVLKSISCTDMGNGKCKFQVTYEKPVDGAFYDYGKLGRKTIRELQADNAKPRNKHPRKQRGADGQAVTKTEAANALGITRPTLDKYLTNPTPPFGDPDKGINYLAAVMSNRANFAAFIQKPQIVAWIKHRNKAIDGETIHPERIDDIPDPRRQQPPAKPTNIHKNRTA